MIDANSCLWSVQLVAVNKLVSLPQKMFKVEKVNCICVDWEHGAWTEYTQAVHNTRVVGAEIAFFVQGLSVNPCPGHMLWGGGRELWGLVRALIPARRPRV